MADAPEDMPKLPTLKFGKPQAIVPDSIEEMWRWATMVVRSGLSPTGMETVDAVMIAMLKGMTLGLSPLDSVWMISIINKRPTIGGDLALSLVRSRELLEEFEETFSGEPYSDDFTAICKVKRKGEAQIYASTYSVADAKQAGLWQMDQPVTRRKLKYDGWFNGKSYKAGDWAELANDSPWFRHPKRMLQMRARGFRFRDSFGDVMGGMHVTEEFIGVTIDGELAPPTPPPPRTPPVPPTPPEPPEEPPVASNDPPSPPNPPEEEDVELIISEAMAAFRTAAENAQTEVELDAAWKEHCQPAVEMYGDQAFNRLSEIDDEARGRIQIADTGPRAA